MQINPISSGTNIADIGFSRSASFGTRNFADAAAALAMNYVLGVRERATDMAARGIAPEFQPPMTNTGLTDMLEGLQRIRELAILSTMPQISNEELNEVQEEVNQTLDYIQNAAQRTRYNNGGMANAYFATENTSLQTLGIAGLDVANYWPDFTAIDNAINMVTQDLMQARGGSEASRQISNEEAASIVEGYMHEVAENIMSEINTLTREVRRQEQQLYGNTPNISMPQPVRPSGGYSVFL